MFQRPEKTYSFNPALIDGILRDNANPLNRIVEIIPENSRVLDIGAGSGILALLLRKQKSRVWLCGIEPNTSAAELARPNYDVFHIGFAQSFENEISSGDFDFIVLADVLEHLNDPLEFLQWLNRIIGEQTKFILSVPNIAFGSVRLSLLNGSFNYVDSGILERTHLRFFTLSTLSELIEKSGLHIEDLSFLCRDFLSTEAITSGHLAFFSYLKLLRDPLASTYQFLLMVQKMPCRTTTRFYGDQTSFSLLAYLKSMRGALSLLRKIRGVHSLETTNTHD